MYVYGRLTRSEDALIRSNQCLGVGLQSFTQYARKDLICDWEKAYTLIVGAYHRVSLFQDRTQSTKISIGGHAFFKPYSVDKLVHTAYQVIAFGLKQLSDRPSSPTALLFMSRSIDKAYKKVIF